MLLLFALSSGCGIAPPDDGKGGSSRGSSGIASFKDCASYAPCGGSVVGRWIVRASCAGGDFTNDPSCTGYASNQSASGTAIYDFGSDGTLGFEGEVSFSFDLSASDACAQAIARKDAAGYCKLLEDSADDNPNVPASVSCNVTEELCSCHVDEGPISSGDGSGSYSASGVTLTMLAGGGSTMLTYCVSGGTLVLGGLNGEPTLVLSRQ